MWVWTLDLDMTHVERRLQRVTALLLAPDMMEERVLKVKKKKTEVCSLEGCGGGRGKCVLLKYVKHNYFYGTENVIIDFKFNWYNRCLKDHWLSSFCWCWFFKPVSLQMLLKRKKSHNKVESLCRKIENCILLGAHIFIFMSSWLTIFIIINILLCL